MDTVRTKYTEFIPSTTLLGTIATWEQAQGITPDEMLVFRLLGTGNTAPLKIKYTDKASENANFDDMKPAPASHFVPNEESIIDPGTGRFVDLVYFEGGYSPRKDKSVVKFTGPDEPIIKVVPSANPALYQFLVLSPRLRGGPLVSQKGALYELLRPTQAVEEGWDVTAGRADVVRLIGLAELSTLAALAPKLQLPHSPTTTLAGYRSSFAAYAQKGGNHLTLRALFEADDTKALAVVEKAIARDVVVVDAAQAMWVFNGTKQLLCPADPTKGIQPLVDFLLMQDGQVAYKQLMALSGQAERQSNAKSK